MATNKVIREPKEYTTERSADEVGNGMKRGGHAHTKHMAVGGLADVIALPNGGSMQPQMGGMHPGMTGGMLPGMLGGMHPGMTGGFHPGMMNGMPPMMGGMHSGMMNGMPPMMGGMHSGMMGDMPPGMLGGMHPVGIPQGALNTQQGGPMGPVGTAIPTGSASNLQFSKKGGVLHKKEGGKIATEERAEEKKMRKLEKELKHHEHLKAGKAHHGLKKGGLAPKAGPSVIGGLAGGIEATRRDTKRGTGTIEGPGYKRGGNVHHAHGGKVHHISGHPVGSHEHHKAMAKHHAAKHKEGGSAHHHKQHEHHKAMAKHLKDGGAAIDAFETKTTLKPKINVNDKVVGGPKMPTKKGGTGDLEGVGYKRGGHAHKKHHYAKGGTVSDSVAKRYLNDMNDGAKMPTKKRGTGDLEGAGYKHGGKTHHYAKGGHVKHEAHGGHVSHHTTHGHKEVGHTHMHEHMGGHGHGHTKAGAHPMRHGGKVHTSKVSTHHKKGGKCNY